MINNSSIANIIYNDFTFKQVEISGGITADNSNILQNSFSFTEALCTEENFALGSCEASEVSFELINTDYSYKDLIGKSFTLAFVFTDPDTQTEYSLEMGKYIVSESTKSEQSIKITAYDQMSLFDEDASEWFNSYDFTDKTVTDLLNDLCLKVGVKRVSQTLINGDMPIYKTATTSGITYRDILSYIGEATASFPHFSRVEKVDGEYALKLYSLPSGTPYEVPIVIPPTEYEDFETALVTKLQIQTQQNDVGIVVGEGTNTYVIDNNLLLVPFDDESLIPYAQNILNAIKTFTYRPSKVQVLGNPLLELGDMVEVTLNDTEVQTLAIPLMARTMEGIVSITDTYEIDGTENREPKSVVNRQIVQLAGKYLLIQTTVDGLITEIADLTTKIEEVADTSTLTSIHHLYGITETSDTAPDEWGTYPETIPDNAYLWLRDEYTYSNGSIENGTPILLGQNLSLDNKAIESVTIYYCVSTDGKNPPSSGWQTDMPEWVSDSYIWQKEEITYSDDSTSETTPHVIKGSLSSEIYQGINAPSDTTLIWLNTNDNNFYRYQNGEWTQISDESDYINSSVSQVNNQLSATIEQLATGINSQVSNITTIINETEQTVTDISSQLKQTDSSLSFITSQVESVTDQLTGLVSTNELQQYLRFKDGILSIGTSNSIFQMQLSNSELSFWQGSNKVAWINNNELHITSAVVTTSVVIGDDDNRAEWKFEGSNGWSFM